MRRLPALLRGAENPSGGSLLGRGGELVPGNLWGRR
jgi:hypothetical protein